jgi:hypothetical protein
MSSCLSVVRIGGASIDNVAVDMLRKALLDHFSQTSTTASASAITGTFVGVLDKDTSAPKLTVTNRYFSAHVVLQGIGQDPPDAAPVPVVTSDQQDTDEQDSSSLPYKEDGVILVFDHVMMMNQQSQSQPQLPTDHNLHVSTSTAAAVASFNALEPVHNGAQELLQAGDLLRLCVGVSLGQNQNYENAKEYEQEYARRILWCLDRGYEYVEADLSPEGVTVGHDVREKDGFARVVEAFCGTVWSSAVMGGAKQKELKDQYAQAQATRTAASVRDEQHLTEEINLYEPPDPTKLPIIHIHVPVGETEEDKERGEKAREAILQQDGGLNGPGPDPDPSSLAYLDDEGQEGIGLDRDVVEHRQKEREQERVMNDFEGALRQATRIRDVSRSGVLSDEERRQRAGDAADLLMGLMGKMGGFEDDDDDDDETDGEEGAVEWDIPGSDDKEETKATIDAGTTST